MILKLTGFLLLAFIIVNTARPQGILKKMKEKASKTVDKTDDKAAGKESGAEKTKTSWCDTTVLGKGNTGNTAPGSASYTLAYSSPANFTIMYDESRLGVHGNNNNYRLILKQQTGNKSQFVIVDNGKVTTTVAELSKEDILGGLHQPLDGLNTTVSVAGNEKYLVAETVTNTIASQNAKTVTTPQTINANQVSQAYEMMKNSPEYKKMSPEEKQKMEEAMKQMPQVAKDYNNSGMGGKTITTPEVKGGTYTGANGYYSIVVKGKNYGRFMGQPQLKVSDDEANVYIVAMDDKAKTSFMANDKKISLDAKTGISTGHSGNLVMSPDGKKAAFVEIKQLTAKEQEDLIKAAQTAGSSVKQTFIVTRNDGSSFQVVRSDGGDKFRLLNSGALVYIDARTAEVVADGKIIGKFNTGSESLNSDALLFGNDLSKICYYSETGSLNYIDGSKKDMGILFPQVMTENGKAYITWFRKCKNDIYIGKLEL